MTWDRTGLIVWIRHTKNVRALKRFGNVHYVSKKMKYAVLYCDTVRIDETINRLNELREVKKIQKSFRPLVRTDFHNKKWDAEKLYEFAQNERQPQSS